LLAKELRELATGRALWTMLLILCPLIGASFFQAVSLYGEASAAAKDSPTLASGLSPLDGVLVPTFGALYLAVTLLFPFVAIRALGREKETDALVALLRETPLVLVTGDSGSGKSSLVLAGLVMLPLLIGLGAGANPAEVDALLDQGKLTVDQAKRKEMLEIINRYDGLFPSVVGLLSWGNHVVKLIAFAAPGLPLPSGL
jgi:hypothetical protein